MSHPDPNYDYENSYEEDVVYDDYNDFYREDEIDSDLQEIRDAQDDMVEIIEEDDYVWDDSYDDSMDGDFDSAMRDAGHGTDEDYGHYGEDY